MINKTEQEQENSTSPMPFPVVGIGASAGGIEAIINLLNNLAPNLGMAYVIVQHLSPDHKSILTELLEKKTSMSVHQVVDGIKIEPDNVYVIPQATYMTIVDGHLALAGREKADKRVPVIDHFLETLAPVYMNNSIAIILSGIGNDGTAGVQSIKAFGGITFAQDDSALFQGMARNAYESGYVDFVMSPQAIAKELAVLSKQDYTKFGSMNLDESNKRELKKIQSLLLKTSGVDFSQYKQTTIDRRILRRLALNKLKTLDEYNRFLRTNPVEADLLYRDLLINVTSFYREPKVMSTLRKRVFPQLFKNRKSTDTLRVWIPACASGEEAASMAIALFEYLGEAALGTSIQIFGTDLSEHAIDKARSGIYTAATLQNLSPALIKQYFTRIDGRYQIIKPLRDICIFATHNLLKDPPFSRIDLISCQNVMIYLAPVAQKKILQAFHYALKPSSFLVLGKSETIGSETELFDTIDKENKIYSNRAVTTHLHFDFFSRPTRSQLAENAQNDKIPVTRNVDADIEKETDKILLSKYVPASIVVNSDFHIVKFNGPINRYLQPAAGKASLHLLKMVKDELIFDLRGLIQRSKEDGTTMRKEGIKIASEGVDIETSIEVTPVKLNAELAFFLIVFMDTNTTYLAQGRPAQVIVAKGDQKQKKINLLENELKEAREHMKSMNEEFEATREELQSANEEVLSTNEELQSINEELETSKEELQSTNEELITINEELQLRNNDLKDSVDYTQGIVETIREPLVVLNRDLRVKTANKSFYTSFKMQKDDVEGYNLREIGHKMFDASELKNQLKLIVDKGVAFQNFEVKSTFSFLGERTLLFNAMRMSADTDSKMRILLAIEDVTEKRSTENDNANLIHKLAEEQKRLSAILNDLPAGILIFNGTREMIFSNSIARELLGERDYEELFPITSTLKGKDVRDVEVLITREHNDIYLSVNTVLIGSDEDREKQMAVINFVDISKRKLEERQLKSAQENLNIALEAARMGTWDINLANDELRRSSRFIQLLGSEDGPEISPLQQSLANIFQDDQPLLLEAFEQLKTKGKIEVEVRANHKNNIHWIAIFGRTFYNGEGQAIQAAGVCFDITDRKISDNHKDEFIAIASHELKTPITSIKSYTELLKDMLSDSSFEPAREIVPKLDGQVERLTGLVMDLLDVTRINEGQMKLLRVSADISELIRRCTADLERTLKKHRLIYVLMPCPPVLIDVNRIEQVILNLISNAAKYSPETAAIEISAHSSAGKVIVSVRDFGIGIPGVTQKRVFDRFFRDNDNTIPATPGMGLGLFIAADIVKRHGGDIWVESEQGTGSCFYFSLPVPL